MDEGLRLDAQNPWPGLAAFSEDDRNFFRGREREGDELSRLVRRERLTVLFGRSGLGKSSLIKAGLFPTLREDLHLPVYVRVSYGATVTPRHQVWTALATACAVDNVEAPPPQADESLWAYFHRAGAGFWNRRRRPLLPVLVFDQFEELFTVGQADEASRAAARDFIEELSDLVEDRPSESLRRQLDADGALGEALDFERRGCKIVISFREDFLAEVEGLRRRMPSVIRNRYRLLPMDVAQARAVIGSGGDLVAPDVAERIIGLAWRNHADAPTADEAERIEIDPALLSVICRELNLRRQAAGASDIKADLLAGAEREILADFYERTLQGLDPAVRAFVEDELITAAGYRDSFAFDDALARPGVTSDSLLHLVSGRLLRVDERSGVKRLELTHDVLTRVVKESRDMRRARIAELEAKRREAETLVRQAHVRRTQIGALILTTCAAGLLLFAGWSYWQARQLAREAAATDLIAQARSVPSDELERQLLLGTEAILRYPHRVEAQVELFGRLLSAAQVRKIWHVGDFVTSATAHDSGNALLGTEGGGLVELAPPDWEPGSVVKLHEQRVIATAWTVDRRTVASATEHEVLVSEWPAGKLRMRGEIPANKERRPLESTELKLSLSSDGKSIAAAVAGAVRVWSHVGSPDRISAPVDLRLGDGYAGCLGFDTDRPALFVGMGFRLWRWDSGTGLSRDLKPPAGTEFAAFSSDCALAVTMRRQSDRRTMLRLWDVKRGRDAGSLGNGRGYLFAEFPNVVFSDDNRVVMVRDLENLDLVSAVEGAGKLASIAHSGESAYTMAQSADRTWSAVAYGNDLLRLDRAIEPKAEFLSRSAHAQFLFFGSTVGALAAVSRSGEVRVLNAEPQRPFREADGNIHMAAQLEFNRTGTALATVGRDSKGLQLWDPGGRAIGDRIDDFELAEFSPDGALVAIHQMVLSRRSEMRPLLEIRSLSQSASPGKPIDVPIEGPATAMAFSWDDRQLAVGTEKGTVTLYDAGSGRVLGKPLTVRSGVSTMAFSPTQEVLAVGSGNSVDLFDIRTGAIARRLDALHGGSTVEALAFSPNGALLASTGGDDKLVLTRVSDGKPMARDDAPTGNSVFSAPPSIVFIEEGRLLAIGRADGAKYVRDVVKRTLLATVGSNETGQHLLTVALSPDARRAALLQADGTVTTRDWRAETLVADACRVVGRNLSCVEWRQFIGDQPYRRTCPSLPDPVPACAGDR